MVEKKRLFDVQRFNDEICYAKNGYRGISDDIFTQDRVRDFIDAEIRRNLREFAIDVLATSSMRQYALLRDKIKPLLENRGVKI